MSAKFIMLPAASGSFVLDAERIVSARAVDGGTRIVLLTGVAIDVAAKVERVRDIAGCLHMEAISDGTTAYFNHRHLEFASVKDGETLLVFVGPASVRVPEDQAETLVQLLSDLG